MSARAATVVLLCFVFSGCGGGTAKKRRIPWWDAPWDRAVIPPAAPGVPAEWVRGEVTEVSEDGAVLRIKIDEGYVSQGERLSVFAKTPENPSPHYLADETREIRIGSARVTAVEGEYLQAEVLESTRRAGFRPGDRVIVRIP